MGRPRVSVAGALSASPDPDPDGAQDLVRLWRAAMAILWPVFILDVEVIEDIRISDEKSAVS